MKKLLAILLLGCGCTLNAQNQQLSEMKELPDPKPGNIRAWDNLKKSEKTELSWGNTDTRYSKTTLPDLKPVKTWKTSAWRGERVNGQALLWSGKVLKNASVTVSDLKAGKNVIPAANISADFVRYVLTDELNPDKCGCYGNKDFSIRDSSLVPEIIAAPAMAEIEAATVRPVWVTVQVPQSVPAGTYRGTLSVKADNQKALNLAIEIRVQNRILPEPKAWSFHLDLWQNPFSVARYYNVQPWSDAHLEKMRPVMTQLAQAGQKVITATLMHDAWGDQTYDLFGTMILRTKKMDGSWDFNYGIFDRWVEFMMSCGIDEQINCYTVVPWKEGYRYFDEASDSHQLYHCQVGDDAYKAYWIPFLKDFARHLREKGWMDKTCIAMDERTMELMQMAMAMIDEADPAFKVALAGKYHKEIEAGIYDYCIAFNNRYPEADKAARDARGQLSTYYTCCAEGMPNTFTFSPLAEAAFIPWHAAAWNYDGYLRWAYNSWSKEPLLDTRWFSFSAGDCWLVYPQSRSSLRFERLVEGIQDYEKIRILRDEFSREGKTNELKQLDDMLQQFVPENLYEKGAAALVNQGRALLNHF